jgi:hypothetical protein
MEQDILHPDIKHPSWQAKGNLESRELIHVPMYAYSCDEPASYELVTTLTQPRDALYGIMIQYSMPLASHFNLNRLNKQSYSI